MAYPELEIGLHRRRADKYQGPDRYTVEVRFKREPAGETWEWHGAPPVHLDINELRENTEFSVYSRRLSESLLANRDVLAALDEVRESTRGEDLRLRLFIGPSAPELHAVWWETLQYPAKDGRPLLADEHILFSRYFNNLEWRSVRLRPPPTTKLKALVVIANPKDVVDYPPPGGRSLEPFDVDKELTRAKAGLGNIPFESLISSGSATLDNLRVRLQQGYDILYLVCHGALIEGRPWLWLENEDGNTRRVAGIELITLLGEVRQGPRLVVLAPCQSVLKEGEACSSDKGALAALGSRLLSTGTPAVLAMQADITMQTLERFMPIFFQEWQRNGQIDQAMAVARSKVLDRSDWWAPVLLMRLKSGRLWYKPGFQHESDRKWLALLDNIHPGDCTPILGPGLTESLLGSHREIAQRRSEVYNYPMETHHREELPQVAQYLSIDRKDASAYDNLLQHLRQEMLKRYGDTLLVNMQQRYGDDIWDIQSGPSLDEIISAVGAQLRERNPAEPHLVLAKLPLPIYITTDPSNMLADALRTVGKQPESALCPWKESAKQISSIYDREPNYRPNTDRPLIYHLFGRLQAPKSLVLTEDDYFDYLIGVTANKELIPPVVRRALVDTSLLFLGFQLDEWNFRVLFRSIINQEGRRRRASYTHVAAQIDPEEGRILEPERARYYLESYFKSANISIYWGSPEDFVRELLSRLTGI